MSLMYKDPAGGTPSTMGTQFRTDLYHAKALQEAAKEQYFSQKADMRTMPKHMGKKIVQYHYIPILDARNLNDQGIDAAGALITMGEFSVTFPRSVVTVTNATKAAAASAINANVGANFATAGADSSGGAGLAEITLTQLTAVYATGGAKDAVLALNVGASAEVRSGNLYSSSKDVGAVSGKMPALNENGGRVNKVGFTRLDLEGTFQKYGFFDEYNAESMNFDTDSELEMHITREMVMAANEINEDLLQIDLLNNAGVERFGGIAATKAEVTGEGGDISKPDYDDFMRLAIDLFNNRTPKHTTIVTGTRMTDTKTIDDAMFMHVGSEMIPTLKKMTDSFGNPAFVAARHYAAGTELARGEIGSIGDFRIIVVPEMMNWTGAGALETGANAGYRATGGRYDVFPLLVIGDQSFTTIGFQTDGKSVKFKIKHRAPESDGAYTESDPFGEKGFMSIKWYYGFMPLRKERIALMYSVAEA